MDLLQRAQASPPDDARVHLGAALRAASDRIWVARTAARIFATHVGDRDAARRVIGELSPLTCIEWRLVAAAWCELGDRVTAGACLERAAANARIAGDLCTVAMGYRDAGYEDEARLLVEGAAQVATHAMDCWIVASCYRDAFRDPTRARALLEHGLRDATAVTELIGFARAFSAHGAELAELEALVERAAAAASTVQDWIDVSRARHQILLDVPAAALAVDRASRLATSPQDERAVAVARGLLQVELLDDERPKLPPSKLLHAGARSFAWDRDPDRLLGWLRSRIPRAAINTLARPEQFFFNDDLVTLLDLQKTGHIPYPLPAHLDVLREVSRRTGEVDHQLRAFACTILCIDDAAAVVPEGIEPVMALLLESCLALGPDAVAGAAALFAALADSYEAAQSTTARGYLVLFAELGLALAASWLDPTDPRVPPLVDRMIAEEREWRTDRTRGDAWLLGLTVFDQQHALWRALARRMLPATSPLARLLAGGRE